MCQNLTGLFLYAKAWISMMKCSCETVMTLSESHLGGNARCTRHALSAKSQADLQFGDNLRQLQLPEVGVRLLEAAAHVAGRWGQQLPGVGGGPPRAAAQPALG